ncbi:hypothetical protein PCE1_004897 [Barthelona sp. PCE]
MKIVFVLVLLAYVASANAFLPGLGGAGKSRQPAFNLFNVLPATWDLEICEIESEACKVYTLEIVKTNETLSGRFFFNNTGIYEDVKYVEIELDTKTEGVVFVSDEMDGKKTELFTINFADTFNKVKISSTAMGKGFVRIAANGPSAFSAFIYDGELHKSVSAAKRPLPQGPMKKVMSKIFPLLLVIPQLFMSRKMAKSQRERIAAQPTEGEEVAEELEQPGVEEVDAPAEVEQEQVEEE